MTDEEVRRLVRKRRLLAGRLARAEECVRGSVVLMKRRCARAGCRRCAEGEGHPTWVLSVSRGGRTRLVYLGEGRVAEARRLVENHRRLCAWVEELAEVNLALLRAGRFGTKGGGDGGETDVGGIGSGGVPGGGGTAV